MHQIAHRSTKVLASFMYAMNIYWACNMALMHSVRYENVIVNKIDKFPALRWYIFNWEWGTLNRMANWNIPVKEGYKW